jgi:drug/metabolite transporter (DMT)-like permease
LAVESDNGGLARGGGAGWTPYLLVCAAPVIWGASGVMVRWAHLPGKEYVVIFYRSGFALLFYLAAIAVVRKPGLIKPGKGLWLLLASGLITATYTLCAFKAYNHINIGAATFIIYLAPVFVALLAPFFLKEKLEGATVLCLALALVGTAVLSWGQSSGKGGMQWTGALGGAGCWAALMLIWKYLRESHSPLTIGVWTSVVTMAVFAPFAIPRTSEVSAKTWADLAVFGVVVIGAAGLIWLYAIARVKAQDAALLSYIEPVSATVFGIVLLGESVHWQDVVGALLILAAGILLLRLKRETEPLMDSRAEER